MRHGDIWREDWGAYDLVYLFQRPETLPRAVAKARAEMKAGARLVSLEFVASALQPTAVVYASEDRPVWVYRLPFIAAKTCNGASRLWLGFSETMPDIPIWCL